MWVYAALSLTAVRLVPVSLSLTGSGLAAPTRLYVGWFGPRGLASIIFADVVVEQVLPGSQTITTVVALTVGMSVLAHGLSAWPSTQAYGRWYERASAADPHLAEGAAARQVRDRRRVQLRGPEARRLPEGTHS
jgi:NhaP-type Na+/H+ or K+/H+ antiporter